MRVVRRDEFLKFPAGTVFAKGGRWHFGHICIKCDSLENDWYYVDPCWVDAHDSREAIDRLEAMLGQGASYPLQASEGRDGCFDDSELFLIFEADDVATLIAMLSGPEAK